MLSIVIAASLGAACVSVVCLEAQTRQQALDKAFCQAIIMQRAAAVRDLLHRGADPNCRQQPASFQDRAENISPGIWRFFHGGEPPDLYLTPLGLAILNPNMQVIKTLLAAGADPSQKDSYGQTPRDIDANGQDNVYWMLKDAEQKKTMP